MVAQGSGLIVEVTDGDFYGYRGTLFYDLAKLATIRLGYAMAKDLAGTGVTALTVTPGFLRSEAVLAHFGVTEANWRDAVAGDRHFAQSETPCFVGRAVAALAADPDVGARAGGVYGSWTLARAYGFDDIDGRRPDWGRYFHGVIDEITARTEPLNESDRVLLQYGAHQFDLDPRRRGAARRIAARLAQSP